MVYEKECLLAYYLTIASSTPKTSVVEFCVEGQC